MKASYQELDKWIKVLRKMRRISAKDITSEEWAAADDLIERFINWSAIMGIESRPFPED